MEQKDNERALFFITNNVWIFAKTYAEKAPHEYLVKNKISDEMQKDFEWFVQLVKMNGYKEEFWNVEYTYLNIDKWKYWTMEKPNETAILINRAMITP